MSRTGLSRGWEDRFALSILRAWELLRPSLSQQPPTCDEERARQPLIWSPLVCTEHGYMLGSRPRLAWGPLAAGPARSFGDWQAFSGLSEEIQLEQLGQLRGGQTMRADLQAALPAEWFTPFEPEAPRWLGAFTHLEVLIAVRAHTQEGRCIFFEVQDAGRLIRVEEESHLVSACVLQRMRIVAAASRRWHIDPDPTEIDADWRLWGNNLYDWFTATSSYDMVAVGAQECDYSPRAPHTDCSKDWIATLRSALGSRYKLVHGLSRGQMRLVVFVHVDSQKAISEVLNGSEATGVAHVGSNKGGICVSLKFWDTSLCFVNCHFAAHEGQYEARNANYKEIVGNICINNPNTDILNQFHHVFWLGDLNYRLNIGQLRESNKLQTTWDALIEKVQQKEFGKLFEMDELRREQEAKRALYAFKEGKITFAPTFKMKKDAEDVYEQKRLPAWCDRVLWSSLPRCDIEQLSYSSIPSITTSDHKPVAASFALTAFALPCNPKEDNVDKDDRRWHVRFTALRAKNLRAADYTGSSDPYVEFFGPSLFQEVQTKVKFQTLNPIWNPSKDVPVIVLDTFAMERIEKDYILVRVNDFDYTSRDDTLGYGVIPLANALTAFKNGDACNFQADISYHGCPVGILEGTMRMTWEKNVTKRKLRFTKSLLCRTQSMRHQLKRSMLSQHVISERSD
ncbi:hypothetical protein L7F22_005628 [Adiantum nelumboides]|nr:hypothetical protein [Adiantum nelumboides]